MSEKEKLLRITEKAPIRFVDRDGNDERSLGKYNIVKKNNHTVSIYMNDWFHSFSSLPTGTVIISILSIYFVSIVFWASLFYTFRSYGFIDIECFQNALIISLETITTVGYTVTDVSFNDQPVAFFLLYGEMMQSVLMNSFCIGVVYARFSRARTRSKSIIFSKKAVIRQINGEWYFMFQVCERRKHQLVESRISCYSVEKTMNDEAFVPYQMRYMKLEHPDDLLGGKVLLILPAVIVHHIDASSPLLPHLPPVSCCSPSATQDSPTVYIVCSTCGECFEDPADYEKHQKEAHWDMHDITEATIRRHIEMNDLEIVVLVEGVESITGNTVQAKYSYTMKDIALNQSFAPCVSFNEKKEATIDFNAFQELIVLDPSQQYHDDIFIQSIICAVSS